MATEDDRNQVIVHQFDTLTPLQLAEAWELYVGIFTDINRDAVQSHVMSYADFKEMAADDRVQKWIAFDDHNDMIGISVIVKNIAAWPFISDDGLAKKFPELHAEERVFYVGFVGVKLIQIRGRLRRAPGVFNALVLGMAEQVKKARGMVCMDYCKYNVDRGLPQLAERLLASEVHPSINLSIIDVQYFVGYDFTQAE